MQDTRTAAEGARDQGAYQGRARIVFDADAYEPMRVMPVTHNLEHHPLLQLPALVDVAQRLSNDCTIRYHDDRATERTSFVDAPSTNPVLGKPEEIVRSIESAHAWLALLGVHRDPAYRSLLDEALESVRPHVDRKDPGMSYRTMDIFVASPGAVTPYHMDHNHSFILQVRGKKRLYVVEPLDQEVVTQRSLELFHGAGSRDLVVYQDGFDARAHKFDLQPGLGGYMPTTAPHWVKNGDNVSVTVSFTYYTSGLRRRKMLHRGNHYLRRLGLEPAAVGNSPLRDSVKHTVFSSILGARDFARKSNGGRVEDYNQAYCYL